MGSLLALLAALVAITLVSAQQTASDSQTAHNAIVAATNEFSKDLYLQAARGDSGNLVISPLSAALALALAWHGAKGSTAQQLGQALHLPQDPKTVVEGFSALIDSFQSAPPSTPVLSAVTWRNEPVLRVANKLYTRRGFRLKEDFRQTAVRRLGADAQELDFAGDPESARRAINQWVEQRTEGKITELLARGSPSTTTLVVIVNALYLKADWMKQFNKNDTDKKPFHLSRNTQVLLPTMQKFSEFAYATLSDLKATALMLPYQGAVSKMKMVIVLPDSANGLSQLEANVGRVDWTKLPWERRTVNVSLPKFRIEATHDLKEKLMQLGVSDLFTSKADLSGVGDKGMYVSKVVQKTFIEVNEKGTEAGAASGIEGVYFTLPPPCADFKADHPFLFFVIKDDIILFMGRVTDPRDRGV